ncbi:MAG: lipopolysaccharide biosynthesis protein [Deltaproteobacteria bacterium]
MQQRSSASDVGPEAVANASPGAEVPDAGQRAGRGGIAVTGAKIYFILAGLVQQVALKHALGLEGYGALSSALAAASIVYNPIVSASIQGVSHAVATAPDVRRAQVLRRTLWVHGLLALGLGLGFFALAPSLGELTGAGHIVSALRVLSAVLVIYGLYAPLVGALNGQTQFVSQAGLDALAATLRTVGLVGGAALFGRWGSRELGEVAGAALGFALSSLLVLLVALRKVGIGSSRRSAESSGASSGQSSSASGARYLRYIWPILAGQVLLNLLFQADQLLLRRFSADAAVQAGLQATAADPLVGAYRATQLFCFLPYQLVISVSIILFPMLARAHRDADRAALARYVRQGMRLALIAAGLLVSVTCGLSSPLLRLVFGAEAALLAAAPMQVLALGLGNLALLGVLTAVLNSLEQQRSSLIVTGLACLLVVGLCLGTVQGLPFGADLLWHTALATSSALLVATLVAGWLVRRAAGAVVAPATVLRVLLALATAIGVARLLPTLPPLATPLLSVLVASTYMVTLIALRELTSTDRLMLLSVLVRRRAARKNDATR